MKKIWDFLTKKYLVLSGICAVLFTLFIVIFNLTDYLIFYKAAFYLLIYPVGMTLYTIIMSFYNVIKKQ